VIGREENPILNILRFYKKDIDEHAVYSNPFHKRKYARHQKPNCSSLAASRNFQTGLHL
jgi:hypothetical protein